MKTLRLASLALALAISLAGCSADRNELIHVGNRVVTIDEFKAVAKGNESQYLGTPKEAKAALFEDLLRRALLLHEAEQRGLYRDSSLVQLRREAENRLLIDAVFQRLAPTHAGVSDAEVARAVVWRDTASRMLVVYAPQKSFAEAAAAEARAGANFSEVADRYNRPGLLPPGGDFGYLTPGSLVAPLDTYLRTSPVGAIVGPFEAPGEGWFVIQVVDRQYRPQGSFEANAPAVREMLRQRKTRLAGLRGYNELKGAYDLHVVPNAGTILYARFNTGFNQGEIPKSAEDETQVLARWNGGVLSLGQALDDLTAEQRPPDVTNQAAWEYWIEQRAMRRVAILEAHARQYDRDPDIRRRIDGAVDNQVLQMIYEQDVAAEAQLLPLDVPAYYETIRGQFQKLDEVVLETALLADSAAAQTVMMHAGHSPDLAAALAMAQVTAPVKLETIHYPNHDANWQMLQATFMSLPAGQYVGPTLTPEGWLLVHIVSKQQRPSEFNELEPMLKQAVTQQAEEKRRDDALRRVVEHLKRLHHPVTHPERLDRIPWPIEPVPVAPPVTTG